ncbi:MAG TPA: Gfo/Idh/MocA family oxidoreductase [Actinomycetes bacterium]|jgi:predicted dehydrogenase|nr:Gfo/Idh/MocA family oxidoreductase [Actinomycetes bacterium]
MAAPSIGVAVVGAGMAGRSHAFGYRSATTVFDDRLPAVRLVAIADVNQAFAADAARRYGFERAEPSWEAVAAAPDVDAVSVVVGNALHREVVEGLLAAGKHVLCEKPLADTLEAARAMVGAAERSGLVGAVGYTFRRSPAANAIRERLRPGSLGAPLHFNGRYWCDYGCDPRAPMSWRYRGGPGSGALADVGSHLVDLAEFLCGPVQTVGGAAFRTVVGERPLPLAAALGHAAVEVGEETEPVDNEDIATFTATFAGGAIGTFSVSRVAFGLPNDLGFELFGETGAAAFDLARPSEFAFCDRVPDAGTGGWRQVLAGPEHPYLGGGLPMAFPGVGHGQNDLFTWQARAFLEQVAGLKGLPPCRSFADGLHTMQVLAGVVESARQDGRAVAVATPERTDR